MKKLMKGSVPALMLAVCLLAPGASAHEKPGHAKSAAGNPARVAGSGIPHTVYRKQGFDLKVYVTNFGGIGKTDLAPPLPPESLACEFPAGSDIEHMTGGGIWIGGIIDTAHSGPPAPTIAVTTGYEGWAGPREEMYPTDNPLDDIWMASANNPVKPDNWDAYWGNSLPFQPVSDEDFYCTYTDTFNTAIPNHVPLHVKVIQKSYAWAGGYADAIIPFEYILSNVGTRTINQAYIGFFMDADVGPYYVTNPPYNHNFWEVNYSGYYTDLRTAYINNPVDRGSTPVGIVLVSTPVSLDSLKYTFRWYPGAQSPPDDLGRYQWLSSGIIMPNQSISDLSDTRFLFGFGPFTIRPGDEFKIVVAVISGNDLSELRENAKRALTMYERGYRLPVTPPSPPLHVTVGLKSVHLDWKWRPGDPGIDPETVVDDSNRIASSDTSRRGKIFEGYRLYRSENPSGGVSSFTLLDQFDVPDQFESNTGLQYTFVDSPLVRGKTYWYAVTSFAIPDYSIVTTKNPDGTTSTDTSLTTPLESSVLANAVRIDLPFSVSDRLGQVMVVPNPYRTDADYTFENGGYEGRTVNWDETKRVLKFIHLPQECTIRIFTLMGEQVATIEHRPGTPGYNPQRGEENWNLLSGSNRAIASGIYVFTVESNLGTQIGKFVVIK